MSRTTKNRAAVSLGRRGGRVGGKSTSEAKQEAARKNGARGGRPAKECQCSFLACSHHTAGVGHEGRRRRVRRKDTLSIVTVCEMCRRENPEYVLV